MYEPTSGTVKQPGTILQHAGAPSVLFQAPSSVTAAGQYVTMVSHLYFTAVSLTMHRDDVNWLTL